LNGKVYFVAESATDAGNDLWRTDGTTAGTQRVKNLTGSAGWITAFAGKLYFPVSVGAFDQTDTLYVSDGTASGTRPFRDRLGKIITGGGDGSYRAGITWLTVIGSKLLFVRNETELWRTKGTASSTLKIADVGAWDLTRVGTRAYFTWGSQLWRSDGTIAGTQLVADFPSGLAGSLTNLDGSVFFFTDGPDGGPWTSNGTSAGTLPVGVNVRSDTSTTVLNGVAYFGGWGDSDELAAATTAGASFVPAPLLTLWRSDATSAGTYWVGGPESHIGEIVAVGDSIFFTSDADGYGGELWRYVP
jgi:ELWxxDGT repeat protein